MNVPPPELFLISLLPTSPCYYSRATPHYRECQDISQQRICVITGKTIVEPNCVEGNLWQRDVGARVTECTVGAYKLIEVVITSVENVRGFRVWLFCVLQLTVSKVHRPLQACYYKIRQMIVQGGPKTNKHFRHLVFVLSLKLFDINKVAEVNKRTFLIPLARDEPKSSGSRETSLPVSISFIPSATSSGRARSKESRLDDVLNRK